MGKTNSKPNSNPNSKPNQTQFNSLPIEFNQEIQNNTRIITITLNNCVKALYLNNYQYLVQYLNQQGTTEVSKIHGYKILDIKRKTVEQLECCSQQEIQDQERNNVQNKRQIFCNMFQLKIGKVSNERKSKVLKDKLIRKRKQLVYLNQSGEVLEQFSDRIILNQTNQTIIEYNQGTRLFDRGQQYFGTSDQKEQIIYDVKDGCQIKIINIKTKKKSQFNIPQQFNAKNNSSIRISSIYLDGTIVLLAVNDKDQKSFGVYSHDLKENSTTCLIKQTPTFRGRFVVINKADSIIVYSYFFVETYQLVFFNYKNKEVIKRFDLDQYGFESSVFVSPYYSQLAQRMSPDFKHMILLEKSKNQKQRPVLKIIQPVETKKLYFHFVKKSFLWQKYGQVMARQLLKVLEIEESKNI